MSKTNPNHYKKQGDIECIELTELMPFTTGNATKYVWRWGSKAGESLVDDLKKARWYLKRFNPVLFSVLDTDESFLVDVIRQINVESERPHAKKRSRLINNLIGLHNVQVQSEREKLKEITISQITSLIADLTNGY